MGFRIGRLFAGALVSTALVVAPRATTPAYAQTEPAEPSAAATPAATTPAAVTAAATPAATALAAAKPAAGNPAAAPAVADPLLQQVEVAIDVSGRRHLDARAHTPWQIIHGVLAYRRDFTLMDGGRKINAIDYLSGGAKYQGTPWFEATEWGGRGQPFTKPYLFEGHPNQVLGYLSLANLPLNH